MFDEEHAPIRVHFHCIMCDTMFTFDAKECKIEPNPEGVWCYIMPCSKCNRDIEEEC